MGSFFVFVRVPDGDSFFLSWSVGCYSVLERCPYFGAVKMINSHSLLIINRNLIFCFRVPDRGDILRPRKQHNYVKNIVENIYIHYLYIYFEVYIYICIYISRKLTILLTTGKNVPGRSFNLFFEPGSLPDT